MTRMNIEQRHVSNIEQNKYKILKYRTKEI